MKRRYAALLLSCTTLATPAAPATAAADWRWSPPPMKKKKIVFNCGNIECIKSAYKKAVSHYKLRVKRHDARRLKEWKLWTRRAIPSCTWMGESGPGPQFAIWRYTVQNSKGSGAYGKFQMMPGTYHSQAKYHDWSPLDQEIAARREFYAHGTAPWEAC